MQRKEKRKIFRLGKKKENGRKKKTRMRKIIAIEITQVYFTNFREVSLNCTKS